MKKTSFRTQSAHSKLFTSLALFAILFLGGCSVFSKLSEVDYNNQVVENINTASGAIEETATLYNDIVPDVVSEKDTIDTVSMKTAYDSATSELQKIDDLLGLESRNIEQQNAVRTELETYQSAAKQYLVSYNDMLTYYAEDNYKEDISKVKTIDENLHTSYTTFIQANNDLVDTLDQFVTTEE